MIMGNLNAWVGNKVRAGVRGSFEIDGNKEKGE